MGLKFNFSWNREHEGSGSFFSFFFLARTLNIKQNRMRCECFDLQSDQRWKLGIYCISYRLLAINQYVLCKGLVSGLHYILDTSTPTMIYQKINKQISRRLQNKLNPLFTSSHGKKIRKFQLPAETDASFHRPHFYNGANTRRTTSQGAAGELVLMD